MAGNRAVTAMLQKAPAATAPAAPTAPAPASAATTPANPPPSPEQDEQLESSAHLLFGAVTTRRGPYVASLIQANGTHREALAEKYKKHSQGELRSDLIRYLQPDLPLAQALAALYYGEDIQHPAAQMGMALIKSRVADDQAMDLLKKHGHPQRKLMEADYGKIYNGVFGKTGWVLWEHLERLGGITGDFDVIKARTLLLRDLSDADKLYFATHGFFGTKDAILAEVQRVWGEGFGVFDRMVADWDQFVRAKPANVSKGLQDHIRERLSGKSLNLVNAVFRNYQRVKDGAISPEEAAVQAAQESMEAAKSGWFTDTKQQIKAAESMGRALDALEKARAKKREQAEQPGGGLTAGAGGPQRKLFGPDGKPLPANAELPETWKMRRRTEKAIEGDLKDVDQIEAAIALRRKPTLADQVFVLLFRKQQQPVLDLLYKAWYEGKELKVEEEAMNPPVGDPRFAYTIVGTAESFNWSPVNLKQARSLLNEDTTHGWRAARCLEKILSGGTTESLQLALKFLGGMSASDRDETYRNFKLIKFPWEEKERPADLLFRHINYGPFPPSSVKKDLLQLVDPNKRPEDLVRWAESRTRTMRSGTGWMVELYDWASGEDTQRLADEALERLRKYVRKLAVAPNELKAFMVEEGVDDPRKLADMAFEEFKEKIDRVRAVENQGVEIITGVVNFVGRSALVLLTGPGGVASLASAIASYMLSQMAKKGFLGDEFRMNTPEFWGNIVSEVGSSAFDALKIEAAIMKAVTPTDLALFGKWAGVAEHGSKYLGEFIKASASKAFEKVPQNIVEGKPFLPSPEEIGARAFHAFMLAGGKTVSSAVLQQQGIYDSYARRLVIQLQKTLINGPPPKSAPIYALSKEFTDMLLEGWDQKSMAEKFSRFVKAGAASVAGSIPAALALSGVGHREAKRTLPKLLTEDQAVKAAYWKDPAARAAYDQSRDEARRHGNDVPDFVTWVHLGAQAEHAYKYKEEGTGRTKEFTPGAFLAKVAGSLDKDPPMFR